MSLSITGGKCLLPDGFADADLGIADGVVAPHAARGRRLDASGLLVLPGIVDLHGDAFERQIQPRPGISFPVPLALADTEAQLLANGITTAFHGITLSWEPGLRSAETWTAVLDALDAARPRSRCDMRVHLRWEAFNLEALDLALDAMGAGRVDLVAFNDHTPSILRKLDNPTALAKYSERAGIPAAGFRAMAEAAGARADAVLPARARIAAAARAAGLPMASHDDDTVETRDDFRALGARLCEFPMSDMVARSAIASEDWVVMGSPNVVRGGSHMGWGSAASMAEARVCRILTSDYYYPALLQAPFMLAARGTLDLAEAWSLVSTNPAAAAGLTDRGTLAPGQRADVILVAPGDRPRVVAVMAAGRIVSASAEALDRLT